MQFMGITAEPNDVRSTVELEVSQPPLNLFINHSCLLFLSRLPPVGAGDPAHIGGLRDPDPGQRQARDPGADPQEETGGRDPEAAGLQPGPER